jgi:hypothetical protein
MGCGSLFAARSELSEQHRAAESADCKEAAWDAVREAQGAWAAYRALGSRSPSIMTGEAYVPVLEHCPARPYVAVTSRVTSEAELRRAADQGFPRLYGWLRERAIVPAGPPLIRFRAFDPVGKPTRIDVGVPIADAIDGGDGIEVAILPAGEWLTFLHHGPYTHATEPDLAAAHATVRAWAAEHDLPLAKEEFAGGETALSGSVEQYRIGPVEEPDYARWETDVAYLIDRRAR